MAVETNLEPRKEWVAPSLKKVNIEEITAQFTHNRPKPDRYDGGGNTTSS